MFTQRAVVVVLDAVVAATIQQLGDVGPLVAIDLVRVEDDLLLDVIDRRLLNGRIQVVVPPLTTLLARAPSDMVLAGELLGDKGPTLGAVPGNQVYDGVVLLQSLTIVEHLPADSRACAGRHPCLS